MTSEWQDNTCARCPQQPLYDDSICTARASRSRVSTCFLHCAPSQRKVSQDTMSLYTLIMEKKSLGLLFYLAGIYFSFFFFRGFSTALYIIGGIVRWPILNFILVFLDWPWDRIFFYLFFFFRGGIYFWTFPFCHGNKEFRDAYQRAILWQTCIQKISNSCDFFYPVLSIELYN